jgi:hypothetical protein
MKMKMERETTNSRNHSDYLGSLIRQGDHRRENIKRLHGSKHVDEMRDYIKLDTLTQTINILLLTLWG